MQYVNQHPNDLIDWTLFATSANAVSNLSTRRRFALVLRMTTRKGSRVLVGCRTLPLPPGRRALRGGSVALANRRLVQRSALISGRLQKPAAAIGPVRLPRAEIAYGVAQQGVKPFWFVQQAERLRVLEARTYAMHICSASSPNRAPSAQPRTRRLTIPWSLGSTSAKPTNCALRGASHESSRIH